jgi:DNA polymerase/3'-5' exonuclease PolX
MRIERARALRAAEQVRDLLGDTIARIAIAGSVRRGEQEVSDLELVVTPATERVVGLFEDETADRLDARIAELAQGGRIVLAKNGSRAKRFLIDGVPVDLYIVRPPAEWGVIMFIRTGPAGFAKYVVTQSKRRRRIAFAGGRLVGPDGATIGTPEEKDVFEAIGLAYLEPAKRTLDRLRWRIGS